jgi:MFS family permease
LLSDYFDKVRLPLAVGLFQSATFLGAGFAYFIGGPLVDYLEGVEDLALPLVGSVRSWHAVFFIVGLPGIILAVVVALTLIEPPRTGRLKRGAATQGSTLLEVRAFLAGRWQLFFWVCLGFMLMATQGFSLFAWSSEYLVRVHSLSRTQAGMAFGGIAVVIGVMGSLAGGVISSWLVARGYPDGMMRLALGKCLLSAPFAIAYGLAPSPELALGVLVPLVFLMSLTPGLGAAVVQAVAPNEMRGQIVAIYGVAVGFLSYVLAPLMVALVTDHVFGFDGAVGMSMALVGGIAYPAASVCLWLGLKHYRKALVAASAWDGSGAQAA